MSPQQLAKLRFQATIYANMAASMIPLGTKDVALQLALQKQVMAIPTTRWSEVEADYNALKGTQGVGVSADDSDAISAGLVQVLEDCIKQLKGTK